MKIVEVLLVFTVVAVFIGFVYFSIDLYYPDLFSGSDTALNETETNTTDKNAEGTVLGGRKAVTRPTPKPTAPPGTKCKAGEKYIPNAKACRKSS
ncbi:unnamed protein product [Diamesa hyperborea]